MRCEYYSALISLKHPGENSCNAAYIITIPLKKEKNEINHIFLDMLLWAESHLATPVGKSREPAIIPKIVFLRLKSIILLTALSNQYPKSLELQVFSVPFASTHTGQNKKNEIRKIPFLIHIIKTKKV